MFEGRDSAGKGGTIQRMREHLNPRFARHVALPAPTDVERGQWYFQRYVEQLPTHGEVAFFDRSWYNRSGVERVMGFANDEQIERFFEQVVPFEEFLVEDGIHLFKLWLSISQDEQVRRLDARRADPLKQWKLSPMDEKAPELWEDYTVALIDTLQRTDSAHAPWFFVNNNVKRVGRLNVIRHVLGGLPYDEKDKGVVRPPQPEIVAPARLVVTELDGKAENAKKAKKAQQRRRRRERSTRRRGRQPSRELRGDTERSDASYLRGDLRCRRGRAARRQPDRAVGQGVGTGERRVPRHQWLARLPRAGHVRVPARGAAVHPAPGGDRRRDLPARGG